MLGAMLMVIIFGAIFKFLMLPVLLALLISSRHTCGGGFIGNFNHVMRNIMRTLHSSHQQRYDWFNAGQHHSRSRVYGNQQSRQYSSGHNQHHSDQSNRQGLMTQSEALSVLGLTSGASQEDIKRAYQKLIKLVHPDKGGSAYLTQKLIQAKDILLR